MRVLQVINAMAAGGAETFVADLCTSMQHHCDIHLFIYAGAVDKKGHALVESLLAAGVTIHNANVKQNFAKWQVPFLLARVIREFRPDVVNVHLNQSEIFCALAARLTSHRPRYVRTLHNMKIHRREAQWFWRSLCRFFDWNIACSSAVLRSPELVLPPDRSSVIENGINLSQVPGNQEDKRVARESLGIPGNKLVLLHIGSMSPRGGYIQKAQDILIPAFANSGLAGVATLLLVGDGSMRKGLEELCAKLGVGDSVLFQGIVPSVRKYLAVADIFVMASRYEGLPITVIESLCAGIPLILSDIESHAVFVGRGVRKCVVESIDSLARAMQSAVVDIEDLRQEAQREAPAWKKRFDIASVAEKYLGTYESLLRGSSFLASSFK